jgi:hypothetical protein
MKPWSKSNAMIASRVVDVHCLPIPQEYLAAQGIAVWNESKQETAVKIQHKIPMSLTPMLY